MPKRALGHLRNLYEYGVSGSSSVVHAEEGRGVEDEDDEDGNSDDDVVIEDGVDGDVIVEGDDIIDEGDGDVNDEDGDEVDDEDGEDSEDEGDDEDGEDEGDDEDEVDDDDEDNEDEVDDDDEDDEDGVVIDEGDGVDDEGGDEDGDVGNEGEVGDDEDHIMWSPPPSHNLKGLDMRTAYSSWKAASLVAATAQGKKGMWARSLRQDTKTYVTYRILPLNPYSNRRPTPSVLDDPALVKQISQHLQSVGAYVRAADMVEFLKTDEVRNRFGLDAPISVATAKRWMARMQYRWVLNPRGQYVDGHERLGSQWRRTATCWQTSVRLVP